MLKRMIYVSSAAVPFDGASLRALLQAARRNNQRNGITGILLYRDGDFVQVLEGEAGAVDSTFARIGRDPRHAGIIVIEDTPAGERAFGDWSMGFSEIADDEAKATPGYADFSGGPWRSRDAAAAGVRRLLERYRTGR